MQAMLWIRDTLVMASRELSKDILDVDVKFPLDKLLSMKDFLVLHVREEEMKKAVNEYDSWDYRESS